MKVILINCYGGALNVDKIASSLAVMYKVGWQLNKPAVLRLRGEGAEQAKKKLA